MFDWYIPAPPIPCPKCHQSLKDWQGKDGPLALMVFLQGQRHPIDQRVDAESRSPRSVLEAVTLPAAFVIYTDCCDFAFQAACRTNDGVWTTTSITNAHGQNHTTQRGQSKDSLWPASLNRPVSSRKDNNP